MALDGQHASWFLAQLKPNCMNIAERNLKQQGFQTFLPLEVQIRQKNNKSVTTTRPVFPGYIFVGFDVESSRWQSINSTFGIARLVSFGKDPAVVPRPLVEQLMRRWDGVSNLVDEDRLAPGDQVVLVKGPFANFAAEVERVAIDQRVWILIDLLGGKTRMAVDTEHLRSI